MTDALDSIAKFAKDIADLLGPTAKMGSENESDGSVSICVVWFTSSGTKYGYKRTYTRKDVEMISFEQLLDNLYLEIEIYAKDKK